MREELLIDRFKSGDDTAFIEVYDKYFKDVYNFVAYSVNQDICEDLTQDIFIKVYNNMDKFKGKCSIKTWVFNIARRSVYDWYRTRKISLNLEDFANVLLDGKTPEATYEKKEQIQTLIQELKKLKDEHRTVLLLRKFHCFSIKETAEVMGYSESKIKTILHRATKILKDNLECRYFQEGSVGEYEGK